MNFHKKLQDYVGYHQRNLRSREHRVGVSYEREPINEVQIFVNYGRGGTEYISILFFITVSTCTCLFKFEEIRWGILCRVCSWHTHNTHTHALKRVSSTLAYLFGRLPQKIGIDCSLFLIYFLDCDRDPKYQRICHFCESQLVKQVFKHFPPCITIWHSRHLAKLEPIGQAWPIPSIETN